MLAFAFLLVLWQGNTGALGALLIFPAGLATGIAHSAVFVGLTSSVSSDEVAIAGSGLYLAGTVGAVVGVAGSQAGFLFKLKLGLEKAFENFSDSSSVRSFVLWCISMLIDMSRLSGELWKTWNLYKILL
jgi:hypothetical protein